MTRDEAIASAGEVYGAILADPERRERLRRDLAQIEARDAAQSAVPASPAGRITRRSA